jgi:hypothetical protein
VRFFTMLSAVAMTASRLSRCVDPGALRRALEDVLIDRGLTNAELFQLLERAKERAGSIQ